MAAPEMFIFPSDLSNEQHTHPYIKINFFNWSSNYEGKETKIRKNGAATFIFSLPETTISEAMSNDWGVTTDWSRIAEAGGMEYVQGLFKRWAPEFLQSGASSYQTSQGQAFNDLVANAWKGSGFRTFQFMFNLVPRNAGEAHTISRIIDKLKELTSVDYQPLVVQFPSICTVEVFGGQNKSLFKSSEAGCTQLVIDYAPGGQMRNFADGHQIQTFITFGITELRRYSKKLNGESPST